MASRDEKVLTSAQERGDGTRSVVRSLSKMCHPNAGEAYQDEAEKPSSPFCNAQILNNISPMASAAVEAGRRRVELERCSSEGRAGGALGLRNGWQALWSRRRRHRIDLGPLVWSATTVVSQWKVDAASTRDLMVLPPAARVRCEAPGRGPTSSARAGEEARDPSSILLGRICARWRWFRNAPCRRVTHPERAAAGNGRARLASSRAI